MHFHREVIKLAWLHSPHCERSRRVHGIRQIRGRTCRRERQRHKYNGFATQQCQSAEISAAARGRKANGLTQAERADRHVLYENSVQCVESEIDFIDAEFERLAGRKARYLREDFCGTANTSCEWVKRRPDNYAVGVDIEPQVLAWGQEHHLAELSSSQRERILLLESDVRDAATAPQDIVLAMNFSYWIFKERALLRDYFSTVHATLASDGVFFLDCFGGYDTQRVMKEHTEHDGYTYTWHQAQFNPWTAT